MGVDMAVACHLLESVHVIAQATWSSWPGMELPQRCKSQVLTGPCSEAMRVKRPTTRKCGSGQVIALAALDGQWSP